MAISSKLTKPLLIAGALAFWSFESEATVIGCEYFLYPNLNFSYCSNHGRRSDTDMLYSIGLMEALNEYLGRKRAEGTLQEKKFEITYIDPIGDAGQPEIEVSQNRRGYYITSRNSSDLNLRHLVQLVEYFASENWRSFCCYGYGRGPESIRKRFESILDREVGQPDMSFFDGRRSVVFEIGDLQVVYENDRLFYSLAGKRLDLEPGDPTPCKVQNRLRFGSRNFIHVYANGVERQRSIKPSQEHLWWTKECPPPPRICSDIPGKGMVHPHPLRVILEPTPRTEGEQP